MDIIALDEQLFVFLNNLGSPMWDNFWLIITNKKIWIPLYIVFAVYIFNIFGWKHALIILLTAGLMIAATDQLSHVFKDILIQRLRPCKDLVVAPYVRLVKDTCGGKYGFFSGHATNHMAIAIYLGSLFKEIRWVMPVLIVWAIFIAYSRIYIGVHYPLDVLTGIFMGGLIGNFFFLVQETIFRKLCKD